jgi:hypothetical protein
MAKKNAMGGSCGTYKGEMHAEIGRRGKPEGKKSLAKQT